MTLKLRIDAAAWRSHIDEIIADVPGLVPVTKGNGYGFGLDRLVAEAQRIDAELLAVGMPTEVALVRDAGWDRDILVLTAWHSFQSDAVELLRDPQVITTVGSLADLAEIAEIAPQARILVEIETSLHRHGLPTSDLTRLTDLWGDFAFEGWTIHLPMVGDQFAEATRLARQALSVRRGQVWVSHLTGEETRRLADDLGCPVRLRVGTKLWLHSPALETTAQVLDIHRIGFNQPVGYWQKRLPRAGWVVVVSGGTTHGVALSVPNMASSARRRVRNLAEQILNATGLARSPFTIAGRQQLFIEPPHMQESLLFVPGRTCPVAVGDQVPVQLRMTTSYFDEVVIE